MQWSMPNEVSKQTTGISAGIAGGAAFAALVTDPAGWLVTVGVVIGACVAGDSASEAFDYFWPSK